MLQSMGSQRVGHDWETELNWYIYIYIHTHTHTHIHTHTHFFHILFHNGLSQGFEYSSLCYTVGPCCLSILGCHALLQGIFPTQGSNPSLPHCRQILYCLGHQGSPLMSFRLHQTSFFIWKNENYSWLCSKTGLIHCLDKDYELYPIVALSDPGVIGHMWLTEHGKCAPDFENFRWKKCKIYH